MNDLVGEWHVTLSDKVHRVEFEHGTTTGKRVIYVDGQEVLRKNWMFKLVGKEFFTVGRERCCISVEALDGFTYEYSLEVNGQTLEKFTENKNKIMKTWIWSMEGMPVRIVLEKDTLDVYINGQTVTTTGEFCEDGTETHFIIAGGTPAYIRAVSSGARKSGIIHTLFVNGVEVEPSKE